MDRSKAPSPTPKPRKLSQAELQELKRQREAAKAVTNWGPPPE